MSDWNVVDSDSRLSRLVVSLTSWVARNPWLAIGCCIVTLGLSIHVAATRLTYRTQRDDLMSSDKACQVRWRNYLNEFGSDDDIVFVVEGADADRRQLAAGDLANRLRQHSDLFQRVFHQVDLTALRDRALLFADEKDLRQIEERVERMGPLLGPAAPLAWQALTLQGLTARASNDPGFRKEWAAIIATAESYWRNPQRPVTAFETSGELAKLEEPRGLHSGDGTLSFVLAQPVQVDRQSFTPVAVAVNRARELLGETSHAYPDLAFGLTGLPVLEHDEMAGTDSDSMRAAWLALAGIALLYFWAYRGARYPLLTVASLLTGTVWALGLTTVTIGHLNILSSAFAVMLIGMGDYGVLWIARFDEERRAGYDLLESIERTAAQSGPSIVTAAITTSLAFYAIMLADFQAVAELGFIAGSGVLLCALACFILMPALLVLTQRQPRPGILPFRSRPRAWMPWIAHHPRHVLVGGAIVMLIGSYFTWSLPYDQNLLHLQSQKIDSVRWETKLLARTGDSGWNAISIASSREEALDLKRRYEQLGVVARVEQAASLVPGEQDRKLPRIERLSLRLAGLPERDTAIRHPAPDEASLMRDLRALAAEQIAVAPFVAVLDEQTSAERSRTLAAFDREWSGAIWDQLHRLRQTTTARPIAVSDLPIEIRERLVGSSGKWLVRAYASENLWEPSALARFVEQVRTVDPEATGKPFGTLEGLRSMTTGYLHAGLYALLAIVVVLTLDFRSSRCVLLALLPLGMGMVLALGVMHLLGLPLNPANLVSLPLIVGVGIDNGVHVLHDYISRSRDRAYRLSSATGRGILIAALTTIIGFATLMTSRHEGMFGLGLILTLGVTGCMLASLIVLPAALCLWDRRRLAQAHPHGHRSPADKLRAINH